MKGLQKALWWVGKMELMTVAVMVSSMVEKLVQMLVLLWVMLRVKLKGAMLVGSLATLKEKLKAAQSERRKETPRDKKSAKVKVASMALELVE